jgi:uncharacterized membrane protein
MQLLFKSRRRKIMSLDFGTHRRHLFGWILLGILAALVVGAILIFAVGFWFGFVPLALYKGFFFFPFGFLIFLLFIFLIFRLAFWGSGGWGWRRRGYYWTDSREILRQRYARGEISKEQLEEGLRAINESYSNDNKRQP